MHIILSNIIVMFIHFSPPFSHIRIMHFITYKAPWYEKSHNMDQNDIKSQSSLYERRQFLWWSTSVQATRVTFISRFASHRPIQHIPKLPTTPVHDCFTCDFVPAILSGDAIRGPFFDAGFLANGSVRDEAKHQWRYLVLPRASWAGVRHRLRICFAGGDCSL